MNIRDILAAKRPAVPWGEGALPWDDPVISKRFLERHLSQQTKEDSRPFTIIDAQIKWIWTDVVRETPCRVVDLCCGPGLYTTRLAQRGCDCTGIDISPASVEYANALADHDGLAATHVLGDIRTTPFGEKGYGLVMMLYGAFNAFRRDDTVAILRRAFDALVPGGQILLEPHTWQQLRHDDGEAPTVWQRAPRGGLLSDQPYLVFRECFWDEASRVVTTRYYAITEDNSVRAYGVSWQAYTDDEYIPLLESCGFRNIRLLPSLSPEFPAEGLMAIVAEKP